MNDATRTALDTESPVNPYSLLEAVNRAADTVNTAWLILLGVISYLLITTAGVTHKDLLLNNEIPLPVLQVKIDLARFFFFTPIILVLFHTGVISQLVLLARKTLEFDQAIRLLEPTDRRTHPLRLETDNFFFVQALAGPERASIMSTFLHGMSWLTLVLLPVLVLLYVQVVFLPFHDVAITTANRVALFADIFMLATIGSFLARPEADFMTALGRVIRANPITATISFMLFVLVVLFSLFVATIPGERLDTMTDSVRGRTTGVATLAEADTAGAFGFSLPFLKPSPDGSLFGLFYRNLVVIDTDLVPDKDVQKDEPSINLRGRDLRFARLDRSDVHQVDFTGADLEGASFIGADMRKVFMGCADIDDMLLTEDRRRARCTDAKRANFSRAHMTQARLAGADLRGARFVDARLEGADLRFALMGGASFAGAHLERADMSGGVMLYGANFLLAAMQGVDLTNAKAMLADFSNAGMQGAVLSYASLEGALLRSADLEGVDLQAARLHNADMSGARIANADLRGATVWNTVPPAPETTATADASGLVMRAPDALAITGVRDSIERIESPLLKARMQDGLTAYLMVKDQGGWPTTPDGQKWQAIQAASVATAAVDGQKSRITEALARLACRARWANGSVLVGIAKRAQAETFKGDLPALYLRFRGEDCPAGKMVSPALMRELGTAADIARGQ